MLVVKRFVSIASLIIGILTLIVGCKPESEVPDQTKIYSSYTLNFNESLDKSSAEASFYLEAPSTQNQQRLELNHPASVTYGGDELVFHTDDRYYKKDFIGPIESNFIYSNYDGLLYTNSISMINTVGLVLAVDTADQQSDYYFEVTGLELGAGESLEIEVESINSEIILGSSFTSISGLIIQIQAQQLQELGAGQTVIRATRKLEKDADQGTLAGGDIEIEYSVQDTIFIY